MVAVAAVLGGCGGGTPAPEPHGRAGGGGEEQQGSGTPPAGPSATTPPGPVPQGDVSFRIANFTNVAADVCLRGDDGVWQGPLYRALANGSLPSMAVSDRRTIKNAHFTARIVDDSCLTGIGPEIAIPVIAASWSVTLVLGESAGGPKLASLVDTPTASSDYSFIRFVNTGAWGTTTDFGVIDDDGNFAEIALDVPVLATPKGGVGSINAEGYTFLPPLDGNRSLVLRAAQNPVLQLDGLTTSADAIYTMYTAGTIDAPAVVFCDDEAPMQDFMTSCQRLPN
jgi:hypothetical protein